MESLAAKAQTAILDKQLAAKIVEGARDTIPYNINIIDERGYIIAGTDAKRIGDFHEIGYQVVTGTEDIIEISKVDDLIGTKPGINMVLKNGSYRFGVLGLTGDPATVRPFASILKLAVETMIDFEMQQKAHMRQQSKQGQLDSLILHGVQFGTPVQKLMDDLNYSTEFYRLPVTLMMAEKPSAELKSRVRDMLCEKANPQDIQTIWDGDSITIFLAFCAKEQKYKEYRTVVYERFYGVLAALEGLGVQARAYVGPFCHNVTRYFEAYKRALWLSEVKTGNGKGIVYFYDHLSEWAQTYMPLNALSDIFSIFIMNIDDATLKQMVKAEAALENANYNLVNASKELFVHKNTLSLWLNRYKELINIDPMRLSTDREFLKYLTCCAKLKGE